MGHPKNKRPTFFNKKSEEQNATIIKSLRTYCAKQVDKILGGDYESGYRAKGDYYLAAQSEMILDEFSRQISAGVTRFSWASFTEAYAWARRYDALSTKNLSLSEIDTEQVALETFLSAEQSCWDTNQRLPSIFKTEAKFGLSVADVILRLQRKMFSYLGDAPGLPDIDCSFGPGANTTCRRRTTAKWKLSSQLACSKDAAGSMFELRCLYPRLDWQSAKIDVGSLSFVPKNAKTDRSIIVEPILNTFVQRGIGKLLKRRLLRKGCNLYDQSQNRDMACAASINSKYSTIDLSAASDNISISVVTELLPRTWFQLLATWRTGVVYYKKGNFYKSLHKFSSMGNGFTFELESCIFYACAQVACNIVGESQDGCSVYGDDIIIPTAATECLFYLLDLLGFTVNKEKSFWRGPFRESCGGDFLLGVDVRPFYLKDTITDARLVAMRNQIFRSPYPDAEYLKLIESFIKPRNKIYGPDGYGDGHLVSSQSLHEYLVPHRRSDGWEGFLFKTFSKAPRRDKTKPRGYAILPSYEAYIKERQPYRFYQDNLSLLSESARLHATAEILGASYARESDVHVLSGGETARLTRVYVPPL